MTSASGSVPLRSQGFGVAAGLAAAVAWSSAGIFIDLMPNVPADVILFGRFAVASVGALVVWWLQGGASESLAPSLRSPGAWGLSALLAAYYFLSVFAYQYTTVAVVALLISTSPLFAILIDWVRLRRGMSGIQIAATSAAIAGIGIIVGPGATDVGAGEGIYGVALSLSGACAMAVYPFAYRRLSPSGEAPSPVVIGLMSSMLGAVSSAVLILLQGSWASLPALSPDDIGRLAALGVFSTIFPGISYGAAAQHLSAAALTAIRQSIPIESALLAAVVLSQVPEPRFYLGAAFTIGGIVAQVAFSRGGETGGSEAD